MSTNIILKWKSNLITRDTEGANTGDGVYPSHFDRPSPRSRFDFSLSRVGETNSPPTRR